MASGKRCETCEHWRKLANDVDGKEWKDWMRMSDAERWQEGEARTQPFILSKEIEECLRYPPVVFRELEGREIVVEMRVPETRPYERCGEWSPR